MDECLLLLRFYCYISLKWTFDISRRVFLVFTSIRKEIPFSLEKSKINLPASECKKKKKKINKNKTVFINQEGPKLNGFSKFFEYLHYLSYCVICAYFELYLCWINMWHHVQVKWRILVCMTYTHLHIYHPRWASCS